MDREPLVATRPLAHPYREIFGNFHWALALARGRRCFGFDLGNRVFRQNHQRNPLPIPLALRPAADLPLIARPPRTARLSPPPTSSRQTAGVATVTALRMGGPIELLAPFEQAPPTTDLPTWDLCNSAVNEILRWAQGSSRSRRSSLGGELSLPPRRFLLVNNQQLNSRRSDPPELNPTQSRDPTRARWPGPPRDFGPMSERY
jgi:hypothetical protein